MGLTWLEKLKICYGILFPNELFSIEKRSRKDFIFNMGYKAGLQSIKAPGTYIVKVFVPTIQKEQEYQFDGDLQKAVNFAKSVNERDIEPYDKDTYAEVEQTFLNRNLDFLL
jgi:hypothetical protein